MSAWIYTSPEVFLPSKAPLFGGDKVNDWHRTIPDHQNWICIVGQAQIDEHRHYPLSLHSLGC